MPEYQCHRAQDDLEVSVKAFARCLTVTISSACG
jgi:hypothetical protein